MMGIGVQEQGDSGGNTATGLGRGQTFILDPIALEGMEKLPKFPRDQNRRRHGNFSAVGRCLLWRTKNLTR